MNVRVSGISPANETTMRRLQKRWLKQQAFIGNSFRQASRTPPTRAQEFLAAVYQCSKGRPQYLIDYLRSDRPITKADRDNLAQLFEGDPEQKPKRGRPRARALRSAAFEAAFFYKCWRDENRRFGVRDHGQGDAMKDEAARFVAKDLHRVNIKPESVRTLMERPAHRRN